MFERRLKIFLGLLSLVTLVLVIRAAQLQIVERDEWRKSAASTMKRSQMIGTTRGSILDIKGHVLARDEACVDACVDYRAIADPPDEQWVMERALDRLRNRPDGAFVKTVKSKRKQMIADEVAAVKADIREMWAKLAVIGKLDPDQMSETRQAIVRRVDLRHHLAEYRAYQRSLEREEGKAEDEPQWQRWLLGEVKESPEEERKKFAIKVSEETEPHVILHAVSLETQNDLGKFIERYPGLLLRPSTHRVYPYHHVAAHLMGRVGYVNAEDLLKDPEPKNPVRAYLPNDLIGRGGVEALAERALRGRKGRVDRVIGEHGVADVQDPVPGRDVRLTIDAELQARLESIFASVDLYSADGQLKEKGATLHGAAVIIDVKSGEVRALASYPTFDANELDEHYQDLLNDQINSPLMNRATMAQLQPGSTAKPMVGLGAITQGLATPEEGIECTGYLMLDGHKWGRGRCWVASKFYEQLQGNVAHHPVPSNAPHPTGFLTFSDALERSCNVYFETMADRLGMDGLSFWFDRFGLGRPTGIGIPEARGRLPDHFHGPAADRRAKTWFSGIGQDPVAATPIQMANAVATIARDGLWLRPRLVSDAESTAMGLLPSDVPDQVDLHLSRMALAAAKDGMARVVSGPAGTGKGLKVGPALKDLDICGKTGTAQAARFGIVSKDHKGKPILDEKGQPQYIFIEPSSDGKLNPAAPWYRGGGADGHDLNHAWYIGFAPAAKPQVAFAVMVEYGGSGGLAAGSVAREALTACIDLGYLSAK